MNKKSAQTAVEYLLLLAVVVIVVVIGFETYLPRAKVGTELFYNRIGVGVLGNANPCGDGTCSPFEEGKCCVDCMCSGVIHN